MARPVLIELILFLTAVRALCAVPVGDQGQASWTWNPGRCRASSTLAIAALLLVVGSFIYFAHFCGAPPGSTYIPAHVDESGKFVPGTTR